MAYALVTGASSGIGECFARQLANRRKDLVLTARSEEKLKALCEVFRSAHKIRAEAVPADLAEPRAAERLTEELRAREIEIDLLINNAGFGAQGRFWTIPFSRQQQMLQLNIEALLELTYLLAPAMVEKQRGAIINVSSTASFQPLPYTAVYAATKSFVTSFSMGLAEELRPYGVKVVTLCPGTTQTNFFKSGEYVSHRLRGAMQSPDAVARAALRKLDRGGGLALARNMDKAMVLVERFLPRAWVARAAAGIFKVD